MVVSGLENLTMKKVESKQQGWPSRESMIDMPINNIENQSRRACGGAQVIE